MIIKSLLPAILGLVLLELSTFVHAQISEQAARAQAISTVRSELHSTVDFKPDRFLGAERDEDLEQSLALAVGRRTGLFLYKISPIGYEIKESSVVYHTWSDFDVVFIVGVNPVGGSSYRMRGFGLAQSLAGFEQLMMSLKVKVSNPDQAKFVAAFYRRVNPENHEGLTPITSVLELKQAAERQCQSGAKSFDEGERAFANWWKHAEPLSASLSFQPSAVSNGVDYFVDWIILSAGSRKTCGGAPLRAQLEIRSDGHVGKVAVSPIQAISRSVAAIR